MLSSPLAPHALRLTLLFLAASIALTAPLGAQRVVGAGDDATVLPRGMLRVSITPTWNRYHERFADGRGVAARGTRESLAAGLAGDSLGPARFPMLAPLEGSLRTLLGVTGGLPVSLGRFDARYDAAVTVTPIALEYGLTRRITLGAVFPNVTSRTEVSLVPNPGGTTGTVGLNPGYAIAGARTTNLAVLTQLTSATQQLQQALQSCAGSTDPGCTTINAQRQRAQSLVTQATAAAAGIVSVYGVASDRPGSRLAPVGGSALHSRVVSHLGSLASDFATFLGAPASGSSWIAARPVGAPPIGYRDFQLLLADPAYGIAGDSLRSVQARRPGDIEVGGKFLLYDAFGARAPQTVEPTGIKARVALGAVYRLATGTPDSVDHFADIGFGDGQADMEGRLFVDVLMGRRFWVSAVARYAVQQADELTLRVPTQPVEPFPPAASRTILRRDLGDALSLDLTPRWVVSDNIAFAGQWQYYRKGSDAFAATTAGTDPAILSFGTEMSWQRAGVAVTYSTMTPYFRRKARTPLDITLGTARTLSGRDGAPAASVTTLALRVYNQILP